MARTKYGKAREMLKELKREKRIFGKLRLREEIIKEIGSDERRTVIPYLKLMIETKLIEDIGNGRFRLL